MFGKNYRRSNIKWLNSIAALSLVLLSFPLQAGDEFCGLRNTTFQAGETLTFKVFYNLAPVYVAAGEANFTVTLEKLINKTVYHIVGDGKTYNFYDNFQGRDKYKLRRYCHSSTPEIHQERI
jgi:hypothetical protein